MEEQLDEIQEDTTTLEEKIEAVEEVIAEEETFDKKLSEMPTDPADDENACISCQ